MKQPERCARCDCFIKRGHKTPMGKVCNDCYKEISYANQFYEEVIPTESDDANQKI